MVDTIAMMKRIYNDRIYVQKAIDKGLIPEFRDWAGIPADADLTQDFLKEDGGYRPKHAEWLNQFVFPYLRKNGR